MSPKSRQEAADSKNAANGFLPDKSFQDMQFWEEFFKARKGQPFEWYAEWQDIAPLLTRYCGMTFPVPSALPSSEPAVPSPAIPVAVPSSAPLELTSSTSPPSNLTPSAPLLSPPSPSSVPPSRIPSILVPGCGNSELSAAMYDAGLVNITNIDLCRDVIMEMMRLHLRQRPKMFWKVMDMTKMQFPDASFDLVLDKGGLDALLGEPDEDPTTGLQFLAEVKRVVRTSGKYACITLAQKHIAEHLVSAFRHGWQLEFHPMNTKAAAKVKPFLAVATKTSGNGLPQIPQVSADAVNSQVYSLKKVVEEENLLRAGGGVADMNFKILSPGRRFCLTLGGKGKSKSMYKTVILDAKEDHEVEYPCGVFFIPKSKAHEWVYSSEEGQWQVVGTAKAGRLIMVFLETNVQRGNNGSIQDDLSPLVRDFLPSMSKGSAPFLLPEDGVSKGTLLEEIDSPLTGTMLVEDVISEKKRESYRRLYFKRNPNLIQSEALLTVVKSEPASRRGGAGKKKTRGNHRRQSSIDEVRVDHSYLASPYHEGMIAGLALIAKKFESWISSKDELRAMVVGLGAGLLPMFLYKHLPLSLIQVVELDSVVGELARRHFGFVDDSRMRLDVGDGVVAVETLAATVNGASTGEALKPLHVLIIDADSSDPSNGLSCPPVEFLQESFLKSAKAALVENGILIINVVSRAREPHVQAVSNLSQMFEEVYSLRVDEDVNIVLFALPRSSSLDDIAAIQDSGDLLKRIATGFAPWENGPNVRDVLKGLKRLK